MAFLFFIGPILLVLWFAVPFLAKPVALLSITDVSRPAAFAHAAAMNTLSLAARLAGLLLMHRFAAIRGEPWLQGTDRVPVMYALSAAFLLAVGFWLGSLVEFVYVNLAIARVRLRALRILLLYNFCFDAIIAVPTLLFVARIPSGGLSHI